MTTRMMSLAILATACTATRSVTGVSGSGPDDVWVVGASTPAESSSSSPYVFHWDGAAWMSRADVATSGLSGVWSPTANNVWFAGDTMVHYDGTAWILHFDGTRWSQSYHSDSTLRAVWGTASNNVWAVGDDLVVVHWDGAKWTSRELSP